MSSHPYRGSLTPEPDPRAEPDIEESALFVVLLAVGAVGIGIGAGFGRPLELIAGILMVLLVFKGLLLRRVGT